METKLSSILAKHEGDPPWQEHLQQPDMAIATQSNRSTDDLMALAIQHGHGLHEMLDLRERLDRNHAAEAWSQSVADFQARCGIIGKTRSAGQGSFGYKYASYEDIMQIIAPLLKECGLAVSFSSEQQPKAIKVTCRIRKGIHYEDSTMTVPIPDMRVNETQKMGAALSYAKRYCLCGALNIVIGDEDTDAAGMGTTITDEQIVTLNEWLESTSTNLDRFLAWAGINSLPEMLASKFDEAVVMLKRKSKQ